MAQATKIKVATNRLAEPATPKGQRLAGNLGPGRLYPGVGKLVQRTGRPYYCGTMTGRIFGVTEHPNSKDPARTSSRFAGQFMLIDHSGEMYRGYECYLPGTVERAVKAALRLNPQGEPVPLSIEVWCEPDEEGRPPSPLGYSYVTYDRAPTAANDPLMAIAVAAGIIEAPKTALPAPESTVEPEVDPETGEVTTPA